MNRPASTGPVRLRALLTALALCSFAAPAAAVDWTGGDPLDFFHLGPNWNTGVPPAGGEATNFSLGGSYDVLWDAVTGDVLNTGTLTVTNGQVTFGGDDGAYTYRMDSFTINGGGVVTLDRMALEITGTFTNIGQNTVGTLNVIGPEASLTTSNLQVGVFQFADGTLNIEGGGAVTVTGVAETRIGGHPAAFGASQGAATVTGPGSTLETAGRLVVGFNAGGTVGILDGGAVASAGAWIGVANAVFGGTGTATVGGAGSTWTINGDLSVGHSTAGTLLVNDGGSVSNGAATIGVSTLSSTSSSVTVTGSGSAWDSSGNLTIGKSQSASLDVEAGATVTSLAGVISDFTGRGTATVGGAGATWTNVNGLYVGGSDVAASLTTGVLNVEAGGTVDAGALLKIWGPGTVNLNGGTLAAAALDFDGTFNFTSGTFRYTGDAVIDAQAVSDLGLTASIASLPAGKTLAIAGAATMATDLRLNGGGFAAGSIDAASVARLDLDAGTFSLTASDLVVDGSPGAQFGAGAAFNAQTTVNVTNGQLAVGADGVFSTQGDLSAAGVDNAGSASHFGGNTVLTGDVTNQAGAQLAVFATGPGSVDYGADSGTATLGAPGLKVDNHGQLVLSNVELVADLEGFAGSTLTVLGYVHVWGTFGGVADVFGPGTLNPEIFSPGASAEFMNVEGNLTLGPLTIMELGGTTPGTGHDQTHVQQTLTLGGTLDVQLIDDLVPGYAPDLGDVFVLFTSDLPILGSFDDVLLPTLAPGLQWLTTQNGLSFSVAVVPLPPGLLLFAPALLALGVVRRRT